MQGFEVQVRRPSGRLRRQVHTGAALLMIVVAVIGTPWSPGAAAAAGTEISTSAWHWPTGMAPTVVSGGEFLGNGCGAFDGAAGHRKALGGYGWYVDSVFHLGSDQAASLGTPIKAIGNGVVRGTATDFGMDGGAVFVEHAASDGTKFIALYGHLNELLTSGAVTANTVLGKVNTNHLHFAVRPGSTYPIPSSSTLGWGTGTCSAYWTSGSTPTSTNGFTDPIPWLRSHPSSPEGSEGRLKDFNGDGRADVFLLGQGTAPDRVFYGRSTAGEFGVYPTSPSVDGTYTPAAGDFNGDGRADVFLLGQGTAPDRVFYGRSTAGEFGVYPTSPSVDGTYTPAAGDFNGDGRADVFLLGQGTAPDRVFYGRSTAGEFGVYPTSPSVDGTYTPAAGDFNGDGRADVFLLGQGTAPDRVFYGRSTAGEFGVYPTSPSVDGTYTPAAGDFNGDGRADVFLLGQGTAPDRVFYGRSTAGEFGVYPTSPSVDGTYTPAAGDFNGDGRADVFLLGQGTAPDRVFYGRSTAGEFGVYPTSPSVDGTYTPPV